jgi:hypothetical protein
MRLYSICLYSIFEKFDSTHGVSQVNYTVLSSEKEFKESSMDAFPEVI